MMQIYGVKSNQNFGAFYKARLLSNRVYQFESKIIPQFLEKEKAPINAFYDRLNYDLYIFTKEDASKFNKFIKEIGRSYFFERNHHVLSSQIVGRQGIMEYVQDIKTDSDLIVSISELAKKLLG